MRTTVRLDDELYAAVKASAARSGRTVGGVIEDALRAFVVQGSLVPTPQLVPLPVYGGSGVLPGVDLANSAGLREIMDEDVRLDARR